MIGSWRIKVGFGGFGAFLTLLFSLSSNPLETTLVRCVYAFVAFTAVAFAIAFVLGQLLQPARAAAQAIPALEDAPDAERGANLDLTIPDEGEQLTELMKERWADGKGGAPAETPSFQPLVPKRVVSLDNPNPEEVVQAIRRLTDE